MELINRIKCLFYGHYLPGSPFINKQGCFAVKCVLCGKIESLKPKIIDKDINHGRCTDQSPI
jgi:hypothetical protein